MQQGWTCLDVLGLFATCACAWAGAFLGKPHGLLWVVLGVVGGLVVGQVLTLLLHVGAAALNRRAE